MSMVRHYPPQPQQQPQLFTPHPSHGSYNSLPASPRTAARRDLPGNRPGSRGQHQLPQQYARPLQRTNSYPQPGTPKHQVQENSKHSEHMLRRKTPNGILTGAYDGTSVEQAEKPHAMKHILLPVTASAQGSINPFSFPYGFTQELSLRSPSAPRNNNFSQMNPQNQVGPVNWDPDMQVRSNVANDAWKRTQFNLPQIDSMLDQIPMPQPNLQYQYPGQQFCGGMEPSFQSPLGPTVSNSQGPFGPYWPNGTYIPYRPAALRDPRYYSSSGAQWTRPQPEGWHPFSNNAVPQYGHLQHQQPFQGSTSVNPSTPFNVDTSSFDPFSSSSGASINDISRKPGNYHSFSQDRQIHNTNASFAARTGYTPQDNYFPLTASGQSTPRASLTPVATPLTEYGPHSSNAQLRERVFTWAHAIYIDLLKYLQQTRRHSSHNRHNNGGHQHPPRPSIYPKPPRQPAANFSSSPSNNHHLENYNAQSGPFTHRSHHSHHSHSDVNNNNWSEHDGSHQGHAFSHSHGRASSLLSQNEVEHRPSHHRHSSWQNSQLHTPSILQNSGQNPERFRTLRRTSGTSVSAAYSSLKTLVDPSASAASALEKMTQMCTLSANPWIDGMLLAGCLAYALGDYHSGLGWNSKILEVDPNHVEAISNLAATLLALNRKQEAEQYWLRAVKLRPNYFEAVEHLIGLLCGDSRGKEAVQVIEYVERSLKYCKANDYFKNADHSSEYSSSTSMSPSLSDASDKPVWEFDGECDNNFKDLRELPGSDQPGFGSSGYAIPGSENGRMLALIHAKGNMLYALGDNIGAARAFENAVMIGAGGEFPSIGALINHILTLVSHDIFNEPFEMSRQTPATDPVLLDPNKALETARLCFPNEGELPGLRYISSEGMAKKAAISTTSNSLLSLAKIFQDGMATNSPKASVHQTTFSVREILALYYLSLSLQPSPSTANNVGILLASVQQSAPSRRAIASSTQESKPLIPGVVPGSGIALALAYYNFGLVLDPRHAHLFTNLGSLFKDIGQLTAAIKMYEQAVQCDGNFDIALANLANAVKDQGRIADAITYYKRAVQASPDFAEAVCGLANALNSVCGWQGRGGVAADRGKRDRWHVNEEGMLLDASIPGATSSGWIKRVVDLVEKQLADGEYWGKGAINGALIEQLARQLPLDDLSANGLKEKEEDLRTVLGSWAGRKWEGARVVRLVERAIKRLGWQWYQDKYVKHQERPSALYSRPQLPAALTVPAAPTVLPFHTFTCPMSAKQIRLISQRNGLRISVSTLKAPWLPSRVFPPPPPPNPCLKVGYVSSDFNNHPLAHLMQSVFGMHNRARVRAYCYATTASDNSLHRQQIEREAPVFYDASGWSAERLVNQIVSDGIHILINLNGYTRGARNEVFAARPAPIQMSFMGFAGTLGAEWCDYLLADETAVPPDTLRPWRRNIDLHDQLVEEEAAAEKDKDDWVYGENIIYCRDTFFCCDHRQSAPDAHGKQLNWEEEQVRRWKMRKEIFPDLPDDVIILGNFNQLYKIEPTTFRSWLRILARLPKAVLWLLRFPDLGETNLKATARLWASEDVASRVLFTDVAPKHQHIARARVCDLFLDTPECNAHTTAADVLWSGTPLLTLPRYKYKMCSRMAASILKGALPKGPAGDMAAKELIVQDETEYENRAVELGLGCVYEGHRPRGRLAELRKLLYEARWSSALFDTRRWVRDLEEAYDAAWSRWEKGEGGDIWLAKNQGR